MQHRPALVIPTTKSQKASLGNEYRMWIWSRGIAFTVDGRWLAWTLYIHYTFSKKMSIRGLIGSQHLIVLEHGQRLCQSSCTVGLAYAKCWALITRSLAITTYIGQQQLGLARSSWASLSVVPCIAYGYHHHPYTYTHVPAHDHDTLWSLFSHPTKWLSLARLVPLCALAQASRCLTSHGFAFLSQHLARVCLMPSRTYYALPLPSRYSSW